ncbi:MAG: glutamine-hydrolyzing GMP synthase [Ruminococcaceae bacterium]|nr:glutamine-hydrolyzing GMP synthase [Oscillospiraceae bacterium]
MHQKILIMDFEGRHGQEIAKVIRGFQVYCEIERSSPDNLYINDENTVGLVIVGSAEGNTLKDELDSLLSKAQVPVLGICSDGGFYNKKAGKEITGNSGLHSLKLMHLGNSVLFEDVEKEFEIISSCDGIFADLSHEFKATSLGENGESLSLEKDNFYLLGFYPELSGKNGKKIIENYLYKLCGCNGDWSIDDYIEKQVSEIKKTVGEGGALCALSGGVDSSVCAALAYKAVGDKLKCIFVDTGLMRKNEGDEVEEIFGKILSGSFFRIDAQDRFLGKLNGVTDPEKKRKIIGEEFIRIFEEESGKFEGIEYLIQGTIYPDIIESGVGGSVVKSHHNVGGLPENIDFKGIIEPLNMLFKTEVRELGKKLGLPDKLPNRQPFPGPGLGVRIIGGITKEKLEILREADAIFREELSEIGLDKELNQYFVVLTDIKSVGVRDGKRTYAYTAALRAVKTDDFMTAKWAKLPHDLLQKVSRRITDEVSGINRVVYDITNKPPGTIEWE